MERNIKNNGSLNGRVFIITLPSAAKLWTGSDDDNGGDYELMDDFISYDEGDLTVFEKEENRYYIFFSISQRVEIFETKSGFIITDGLFFNEPISPDVPLSVQVNQIKPFTFEVSEEVVFIFDAANEGKRVLDELSKESEVKYDSGIVLSVTKGSYSVNRCEILFSIDGENISLKGIEFAKSK